MLASFLAVTRNIEGPVAIALVGANTSSAHTAFTSVVLLLSDFANDGEIVLPARDVIFVMLENGARDAPG